MTLQEFFGIGAGIVELVALPLYIRSILKGGTKPDRVTWWVLTLVSGLLTASYFEVGAEQTIWLPLAFTIGMFLTALLSIKYGEGKLTLNTTDRISLIGAIVSLAVWSLLKSPITALYLIILTEFIGLYPTIQKSYMRPWTESKLPWILGTVAAALNVLAIDQWTLAIALYPWYVLLTNTLIIYFLVYPRKKWPHN